MRIKSEKQNKNNNYNPELGDRVFYKKNPNKEYLISNIKKNEILINEIKIIENEASLYLNVSHQCISTIIDYLTYNYNGERIESETLRKMLETIKIAQQNLNNIINQVNTNAQKTVTNTKTKKNTLIN